MRDPLVLDRLRRGPDFRESPGTSFEHAFQAVKTALEELRLLHKPSTATAFDTWSDEILASFRQAQEIYERQTPPRQQAADLNPVHGKLSSRKQFLESYFEKYTFLVADKSRGDFVMVCNNLMRLTCVQALSKAEDYQRVHRESEHIVAKIFQDMVGMLNMKHVEMLKENFPYFYVLPKLHKQPIGWRPVTACVNLVSEIPHRILAQCLRQVVNTLKDFQSKEFANSQGRIRKWWTVENSLEYVTNLSEEEIEDLFSSDIDSMFSKMDQDTVCQVVREEILFAAQIVNANAFFVVLYDTQLGNSADEGCWFNSFPGLDPSTGQQPSLKRTDKGVAYSLERICQLNSVCCQKCLCHPWLLCAASSKRDTSRCTCQ
jgi:hypothetical protein